MTNSYYNHTTYPANGALGSASAMRTELELITTAFNKLPTLAGNASKIIAVDAGATVLEVITTTGTGSGVRATSPTLVTPVLGAATATTINKVTITAPATAATLTLADGSTLSVSGAFASTLTFTAGTNVTFPAIGTLATLAGAEVLTNKTLTTAALNGTVTGTSLASSNTASTLVMRDSSGNFAAGTVTAALTGNASTATALQNARLINGTSFNGTADITISSTGLTVSVVSATTQTAVAGTHYILTNVAATTVTLPASPASGDTVWITITNSLTTNVIVRNGQTIMGIAEDMTVDNGNATVELRFVNSSWRLV